MRKIIVFLLCKKKNWPLLSHFILLNSRYPIEFEEKKKKVMLSNLKSAISICYKSYTEKRGKKKVCYHFIFWVSRGQFD